MDRSATVARNYRVPLAATLLFYEIRFPLVIGSNNCTVTLSGTPGCKLHTSREASPPVRVHSRGGGHSDRQTHAGERDCQRQAHVGEHPVSPQTLLQPAQIPRWSHRRE